MAVKRSALQKLELQLREAQTLAHFGSWEWDLRANRVTWSDELYEIFGVDRASFTPSLEAFLALVHPEDRARVTQAADENRQRGTPYSEPIRIVRPDGSTRTIRGGSHMIKDASGQPVHIVGVLQDISDQTAAQEGLRVYAEHALVLGRRLVEAQEQERRHLSRELHDRIGPAMTSLSLTLARIEKALPPPLRASFAEALGDAREQVSVASQAMRDVMGELRPHGLDEHGLGAALRELAVAFERHTGLAVALAVLAPERRAEPADLALFRITQEALNNAAKHARARSVAIRYTPGALLEIEDDGIGFDQGGHSGAGWGLLTMRERAAAVGASCEVLSQAGRGTLVRVTL